MDFRDLNGNGRLDPYEDPRRPVEERVDDLLSQMTLWEKAGLMYHAPIGIGPDGELLEKPAPFSPVPTPELVCERRISHFNIYWRAALWRPSPKLRLLPPETMLTPMPMAGLPLTRNILVGGSL